MIKSDAPDQNAPVDFRHIRPVRWAETRRRMAVIQEYLSNDVRTDEAASKAGGRLRLSKNQFRRLIRAWELHADPRVIQPRGDNKPRRRRSVSDEVNTIIEDTIQEMGAHAQAVDIVRRVQQKCSVIRASKPSDQHIWNALMRARRLDRAPAPIANEYVLLGRVWFDVPVQMKGHRVPQRPEAIIAMHLPSKAILASSTDIAKGRPPKIDDILSILPVRYAVRVATLEASLMSKADRSRLTICDNAQAELSRWIGSGLGNLGVRYRRPRTDASDLIATSFDRALSMGDATLAVQMALQIHAEEILTGHCDEDVPP